MGGPSPLLSEDRGRGRGRGTPVSGRGMPPLRAATPRHPILGDFVGGLLPSSSGESGFPPLGASAGAPPVLSPAHHDADRRATLDLSRQADTPSTPGASVASPPGRDAAAAAEPGMQALLRAVLRELPGSSAASADFVALQTLVHEQRLAADALQSRLREQQGRLDFYEQVGPAPAPQPPHSYFTPGPFAVDEVARLTAHMAEQQRRMEEQQHLIEQLLRGSRLVPPPPVVVPPPVSSAKNKSVEPGKELRANPEFLRMTLGAGSSALDVSRVVLKMFSLWGSAGSTLRQLLLWVLQLPASATSLVPASVTDAVRVFCADHLKFSLDSAAGVAGDGGADCFGCGADSARRRGVFQALLVFLQTDGPLKDMDAELLISFTGRLQPSLRLSDATLAVPTFAALLVHVLLALGHGPSTILVSVVDAFFSHVPYPDVSTANNMLRAIREDLAARLALQEQLAKTPFLLPVALSTCTVPTAPGASGLIVSNVVSELMGLAADSATSAAQLLAVLDHASRTSGHAGGAACGPWEPAASSPFGRLLALRSPSTAADSPTSSASPAAASLSPTKPAQAPSKSAASKAATRPAAAKSQQRGGGAQLPCPHGADCTTHGALYGHCKFLHTEEAHRAIQDRVRSQNGTFFTQKTRLALKQQIAAQGGPPGGGGGGGQPKASPSPSAAAAAAPAPQPVPQLVPQPAPPPAMTPSQPVSSAALAAASAERVAALQTFLGAMGAPGFAALGALGVAAPPSMANVPAPVAPVALAASAPAHTAGSLDVPIWGGRGRRAVIVDSGSKDAHGPNTAGAPTRRVPAKRSVTSTGVVAVADREFSAAVCLRDAQGQYYKVVVGDVCEQPGLVIPPAAGESAVPVLLLDLGKIAGQGGLFHVEGQWASDSPSEPVTVVGWVRLRVHDGDPRVDPRGRLSPKIPCVFDRGVVELPTFDLPAGAEPVPVFLGRPSPALSASSVALAAPERAFADLLRVCRAWHSGAASLVPVFAASSPGEQAAYKASNGGLDAAAQLHLGLSLFSSCLDDLARAVLCDIGVAVPSWSALPSSIGLADGSAGVQPAPSALVALLGLVNAPALAPSSGAVLSAAPPASSSPSLLSPQ